MPKEKRNRKNNTPAYKKEGAHQKQTQSLARNNISQMDKEDVKKMLDSDYFNLGITLNSTRKWITCWMILRQDRKKSSIAS